VAAQPTLPVQFSVPVDARKDLRRLALDISDDIVPNGELRYTEMCAYAALHLLSVSRDEVKRILAVGMSRLDVYGEKATPHGNEPQPQSQPRSDEPQVKPSPPVNVARVWEAPLPKPGEGDVKGLDRDRPTRPKVRKSPRRK
jgi:hypothetical protein